MIPELVKIRIDAE
jgi:hypothetical protein